MGRNKYSQSEIDGIAKLLRLKNAANRARQKEIRHQLRTQYEFNISDFNEPGKAFGEKELLDAIQRRAILILDDRTIANMKAKQNAQGKDYLDKAKKSAQNSGANDIQNPPPADPEPEKAQEKGLMNAIHKMNGVK